MHGIFDQSECPMIRHRRIVAALRLKAGAG
jgi:hypothetical protein